MKQLMLSTVLLTCLTLGITASQAGAQTQNNNTPLTNAAVIKLVRAGFKEKSVISIIGSRAANFDLSTDGMIELKKNNVSEKIILAMLGQQQGMDPFDDDMDSSIFGNDNSLKSSSPGQSPSPGSGNSTDIFGSSGGSRGEIKTRGGSGGSSGDTVTTGSATVRILRPPSEAGAPTKLEKTTSLTNDMVVELVEAGFTEGTIIRRIEQSPVAFDLAPEKLAELRRHRVSEKILTAMKAAMGSDASPENTPARTTGNVTPRQ